ncbi:hypothetical protein BRD13_05365 [Halobacteriales archaeon SW_5_70_135]|nr:MAG: hypothetical protein BRD13_05365 [Halobacteriales archaeon SW_5_70_135]
MSADSPTAAESESEPGAGAGAEVEAEERSLPLGRFGRLVTLTASVTAVFLFVARQALDDELFQVAVVVIGSVAVVTAISGFLVATVVTLERE